MVAAEQHRRHRPSVPHFRPRVMRPVQQSVANESCTADSASPSTPGRSRATASITIERRQLAARQHIVADRQLSSISASRNPLVDPSYRPATSPNPGAPGELGDLPGRTARRPRRARSSAPRRQARFRGARPPVASGSAFSTMPGPPPKGRSSTVRCGSSRTAGISRSTASFPASTARPRTPAKARFDERRKQRHDLDPHAVRTPRPSRP